MGNIENSPKHSKMKDAELYLSTLDIPCGLPELNLTLHGSSTFLSPGLVLGRFKNASLHSYAPSVYVPSNCILLCLDPDAPMRSKDGVRPGRFGPRLHWFRRGTEDLVKYDGPAPSVGTHRYIFVLFEEIEEMIMPKSLQRKKWNVKQFLTKNKNRLKPIKINFFYCFSD